MAQDKKKNPQKFETKIPWRFLTALDGDDATDRELVALTRRDEVQIITNMVAASGVSILYAFSGNGKSSLINAGLIPFFNENGYAVFKMRPRPPWSIESPTKAFKDSLLRDVNLPLFKRSDLEILHTTREYLETVPEARTKEIENFLARLESKITDSAETSLNTEDFKAYLQNYLDKSLAEFISHIQSVLDPETNLLFICDQFEELFVHYGNTPEMDEFVSQLGEVWADNSLRAHLLFSMREDWVGSMIEFRKSIPDIFANYFKLNPITRSHAGNILTLPLKNVGISIETKAVEQILEDLVQAYSRNQKERFSEVKLTPSPQNDPFIELPALQVLADKLWETKDMVKQPFSLAHYQSLKDNADHEQEAEDIALEKTEYSDDVSSPAQVVLDNYMTDLLSSAPASDKLSSGEWRDLRIDCLYLLTDKTRHRRALPENLLLEEVKQIRPQGLNLPEVNEELMKEAIEPMVKIRLVREEVTKDRHKQYELAHDFAVRSAVKNWRRLDRERTSNLAILSRRKQEREEKLSVLEKIERRLLRLLQFSPLVGILALATSLVILLIVWKTEELGFLQSSMKILNFCVVGPFILSLIVGLLVKQRQSIWLGGICGITALVYLVMINHIHLYQSSYGYEYLRGVELALIPLIPISVTLLLLYVPTIVNINRRLNGSLVAQKYSPFLWSELIDAICFLVPILYASTLVTSAINLDMAFYWPIFIILVVGLSYLSAWWLSKKGKNLGYNRSGFVIRSRDGGSLSIGRALWRQFLFLLWTISNIAFGIPWLIIGPLIICKYQRNIYDILAGTVPVLKEEVSEKITIEKAVPSLEPRKGIIQELTTVAKILFTFDDNF